MPPSQRSKLHVFTMFLHEVRRSQGGVESMVGERLLMSIMIQVGPVY